MIYIRNFAQIYSSGGIPCRIIHGNVKLSLKWDKDPKTLEYDPLLLVSFEGLQETMHPFNFTSREIVKTLLDPNLNASYEKVKPILSKLVVSLRNALASEVEFIDNLSILSLLSNLVKADLNSYLHLLLQPLNKVNLMR